MKHQKLLQNGFAHLHIILVLLVVAVIGLAGGNIYQAQSKKRESARQAAKAEELAKQAKLKVADDSKEEKVTVPSPAAEQKPVEPAPTPKPAPVPVPKKTTTTTTKTYTYVGISNVSHTVNDDIVTLTATLPASYNGVCGFKIKVVTDYSKYHYKEATFNGSTCSVTLSKATLLGDSSQWIAFTNFRTNDYTVKGDHSGYTFNL